MKLSMYPDGGIARFRVYGIVQPVFSESNNDSIDLAHVYNGGRVVFVSDQHFGVGSNLLLPGRGKVLICVADGFIRLPNYQARTWEMVGRRNAVGQIATKTGL